LNFHFTFASGSLGGKLKKGAREAEDFSSVVSLRASLG
jgi:hypothetical protein